MPHLLLRRAAAVLAPVLLAVGCVNVEYGIRLDEDLSGTMELAVGLNVDQMAYGMAMMQRSFAGEQGTPTDEEVAEARERILADLERERDDFDVESIRREASEDLPEGIELVDATQSADGMETRVRFRFDHVRRLEEMAISPDRDEAAGPEGAADADSAHEVRPFSGLVLRDEGDTWLLRNDPVDPVAQARAHGAQPAGTGEQVTEMMEAMGGAGSKPFVRFYLELPSEPVEHNATRVEGRTLYWEYGLDSFAADSAPPGIRARFRKP